MHPRNSHGLQRLDFGKLADVYPELQQYISNNSFEFNKPEALIALTTILLKQDFDLNVTLDPDRLVPRIPNRLNYIYWIQDLLDSDSIDDHDHDQGKPIPVLGLDIGTGASCIYPLLACRLRPSWQFIGSDVDSRSIELAIANVNQNNLQHQIKICQTDPEGDFFDFAPHLHHQNNRDGEFSFTMCNPPFYESVNDVARSSAEKQPDNEFFACMTGTDTEMVTNGGEYEFVRRMILESINRFKAMPRTGHTWYTCMLGKLQTLKLIVHDFKTWAQISNHVVTELVQGNTTTRRWAIAWRFGFHRVVPELARPSNPVPSVAVRSLLPLPTGITIQFDHNNSKDGQKKVLSFELIQTVLSQFDDLEFKLINHQSDNKQYGLGRSTHGNVWSRKYKRQKKFQNDINASPTIESEFQFRIFLSDDNNTATVHWKYGNSFNTFESFCGMLKTKINDNL
ncbi:hypothetical protein V1514DRAFT_308020 [Lipomyces japonicus]|uniref:uncharacterized protein n=1 Tax=Lipomyces japonicus TaxID=56871 RepID=UPI0034CFDD18